jgi:hypothetical protein
MECCDLAPLWYSGAALGVWRRLRSLPKTTKAGTSPRTPYLFTQLKNAVINPNEGSSTRATLQPLRVNHQFL